MKHLTSGLLAGFVATVVLSALMILKSMMGVAPQLNVIAMLARMVHEPAAVGWIIHFAIGAILWGAGFSLVRDMLPGGDAIRGMLFSVGAWLLMMVVLMPMAGAGLFALKMGPAAPVMTLVLHLIFGAVMGAVFHRRIVAAG